MHCVHGLASLNSLVSGTITGRCWLLLCSLGLSMSAGGQTMDDVDAPSFLRWSPFGGSSDVIPSRVTDRRGYPLYALDTDKEQVVIAAEESVLVFDLASRTWITYPSFPMRHAEQDVFSFMAYDPVNKRFRLMVQGGGVVYHWRPGETKATREDRSFVMRNQYRGAMEVDRDSTGALYLFGGEGLWSSKDLMIRYDTDARDWFLMGGVNSNPVGPRSYSTIMLAPDRNRMYLIGGIRCSYTRQDCTGKASSHDVWSTSLDEDQFGWEYHFAPYPDGVPLQVVTRDVSSSLPTTKFYLGDGLGFFVGDYGDHPYATLYWMDFDHNRWATDRAVASIVGLYPLAYFQHPSADSLLVLGFREVGNLNVDLSFQLEVAAKPRPEEVRAFIYHHAQPTDVELRRLARTKRVWQGGLFVLLLIATGVYFRRRISVAGEKVSSSPRGDSAGVTPVPPLLVWKSDGRVFANHDRWIESLSPDEQIVWQVLVSKVVEGYLWASTSEIEQAMSGVDDDYDYLRKRRNVALQRLRLVMQQELSASHEWLLSRRSPFDRRRMEYALNPDLIQTQKPGDRDHSAVRAEG